MNSLLFMKNASVGRIFNENIILITILIDFPLEIIIYTCFKISIFRGSNINDVTN